jgi:formamidopyrimidine-DNA glycosylase
MPELPEVETVRAGLRPVLEGRRLREVIVRRGDLRFPLPSSFAGRLLGRRVDTIDRHGKYLLIRLSGDLIWLAHLGMSGRFRLATAEPDLWTHDHLVFVTEDGGRVVFHDPRRFGFMDLLATADLERHPRLADLGPDPLGPAFGPVFLSRRLERCGQPIKAALLDQRIVAGMGNIYASESLFRIGVSPFRPAEALARRGSRRLVAAIRSVFAEAIAAGGSSMRDHVPVSGELGTFQHRFAVYHRAGQRCPGCSCDIAVTGGIRRVVLGGRATYFCVHRQR